MNGWRRRRRARNSGLLAGALAVLGLSLAWAPPLAAVAQAETGHTLAQAFSAALRYLRVDLGYRVVERDAEAAYLLFDYPRPSAPDAAAARGAIEVIALRRGVRVAVTIQDVPAYHEEVLKRGLLAKLRAEQPEPSPQRPPARGEPGPEPESEAPSRDGAGDSLPRNAR